MHTQNFGVTKARVVRNPPTSNDRQWKWLYFQWRVYFHSSLKIESLSLSIMGSWRMSDHSYAVWLLYLTGCADLTVKVDSEVWGQPKSALCPNPGTWWGRRPIESVVKSRNMMPATVANVSSKWARRRQVSKKCKKAFTKHRGKYLDFKGW